MFNLVMYVIFNIVGIQCSSPTNPENGKAKDPFLSGTDIAYDCDTGYRAEYSEDFSHQCNMDGTLTITGEVTCVSKSF